MQFPRWFGWLILIFIGYILVVGNYRAPDHMGEVTPSPTGSAPKEYPHLRALTDGTRWRKALNPDYRSPDDACAAPAAAEHVLPSYAIVTQEGDADADAAKCGDTLPLIVAPVNAKGQPQHAKAAAYTLGLQPAFDALVVGMRPAEVRLVVFTPPATMVAFPKAKPGMLQVWQVTYPLDVID